MTEVNFYEGKTAVIYARVSTEEQADRATSIETQLKRARKWCEDNGIRIIGEYYDGGVSGTTHDRDGYSDMFAAIITKRPNYIVVRDPSRVTREGPGETEKLRDVTNALKVEFHFLEKGRGFADEEDETTEMMDDVESLFNRHYAKTAKKNTRQSIRRNIKEGKHVSRAVTFAFEEDIPLMPAGRILYEDHVREVRKNGVLVRKVTPKTKIRTVDQFFALVDRGASYELIAKVWQIHRGTLERAIHGTTLCGLPKRMKVGICEDIRLPNRFDEYQRRLEIAKKNGIFDHQFLDPYCEEMRAEKAKYRRKKVTNRVDDQQGKNAPVKPENNGDQQGGCDE